MNRLLLYFLLVGTALGQQINLVTNVRGILRPVNGGFGTQPGTTLPALCTTGQTFVKTNAVLGVNLYVCTSTNTWTVQTGAGGAPSFAAVTAGTNVEALLCGTGCTFGVTGSGVITATHLGASAAAAYALLASPIFTGTPTIPSFTLAGHTHQNAAGGGTLSAAAIAAGILTGAVGGTGNGFFAIAGPATSLKTWTIANASIDWTALTGVGTWTAGVPGVVPGTATDCVLVNGTSGACGAGSGDITTIGDCTSGDCFSSGGAGGTAITIRNATSGTVTLKTVTGALGAEIVSLPAATDTLIGKATADTLTNKTFDTAGAGNSLLINGLAATANTGTGSVVRATAPTLGAITVTSVNKVGFTAPATGATIAIPDGVTMTGPPSSATVATLGLQNTFTGRQDAGGAASTAPAKVGTTLPVTCTVGDQFFKSNAIAGLYGCQSTDIWTPTSTPFDYTIVSFSTTPTFTAASNTGTSFLITLTGNVTSSTLASASQGQVITFNICQDATGGRTFVYPTTVLNAGTIDGTASACTHQVFVFDGSNAQALAPAYVTGVAGSSITFFGSTSGSAKIQSTAIQGAPNPLVPPTATGTSGYFLTTNGANPQQLSWALAPAVAIKEEILLPLSAQNKAVGVSYPSGLWEFLNLTTAATVSVAGTGTIADLGAYHFDNTNSPTILHRRVLPGTWTSTGGVDLSLAWVDECCGSGNVKWIVDIGCAAMGSGFYAYDSVSAGNISFNAASNVTTASGGGGAMPKLSTLTGLAITNCSAGSQFFLRVARDNTVGSNMAGIAKLIYAMLTIRRTSE